MNKFLILIICCLTATLTGCAINSIPFAYKIDIAQGNLLEKDRVDQLKKGMTRQEVTALLGSPMLVDPFHINRWDYYYSMKKAHKPVQKSHLIVFFKENSVNKIVKAV